MTKTRQAVFVVCKACDEIFKALTVPMAAREFCYAMRALRCPNCGARKDFFICANEGPRAVTEAKDGRNDVETALDVPTTEIMTRPGQPIALRQAAPALARSTV